MVPEEHYTYRDVQQRMERLHNRVTNLEERMEAAMTRIENHSHEVEKKLLWVIDRLEQGIDFRDGVRRIKPRYTSPPKKGARSRQTHNNKPRQ